MPPVAFRRSFAFALSSVAVAMVAYACGSTASSPLTTSCTSLQACCLNVPVSDQASCLSIADGDNDASCSELFASYSSEGVCTTSVSTSAACTALAACCADLPVADLATCNATASAGVSATCTAVLDAFTHDGECGGASFDAGNGGDDSGTTTGDDSGTVTGDDSGTITSVGDGGACSGSVGGFPSSTCDPSDEQACGSTVPSGCTIDEKCGDPNTCEPFTQNPAPGAGTDSFRMRLINVTAPAALTNVVVQGTVITAAVDLPATGASCGENGTGLFNWLIQVDQATGKVTTGGAPASSDPFGVGYCFSKTTIAGLAIAPVTVDASFTGASFETTPTPGTLNMPIYVQGGDAIVLPITAATLHDVTISEDGNCIGQIDNGSLTPSSSGPCTDPTPTGADSCSRWHSAGAIGGYINLATADQVPVIALGGGSLCTLLTGQSNGAAPAKCPTSALTAGDYCSTTGSAGGCRDSFWFSAQFAASAVKITSGAGVADCGG